MKKSSDPDIRNKENEVMPDIASVNTQHRGKYHCTTNLLFGWFVLDQTSKTVVHSTLENKINSRSAV